MSCEVRGYRSLWNEKLDTVTERLADEDWRNISEELLARSSVTISPDTKAESLRQTFGMPVCNNCQ
jgi:hypothetical protein